MRPPATGREEQRRVEGDGMVIGVEGHDLGVELALVRVVEVEQLGRH